MGCDIHAHIEYERWEGEYIGWGFDIDINRNYTLFSVLANVRNGGEIGPISEPRGLPKDISMEVMEYYNEERHDAHSCSWLNLNDLVEANKRINKLGLVNNDLDIIISIIEKLQNGRLVFWFDN
jgi:hypothetical protein